MNLKAKYHYNVPSNNNLLLISYLQQKISIKDSLFISIAVILELYSRTFGFLDFLFGKEQIIWKVEKSIL
jgi:hypothetical protein